MLFTLDDKQLSLPPIMSLAQLVVGYLNNHPKAVVLVTGKHLYSASNEENVFYNLFHNSELVRINKLAQLNPVIIDQIYEKAFDLITPQF